LPTSQDVIDGVNAGTLKLGYNVLGSYAADQAARLPDLGLVAAARLCGGGQPGGAGAAAAARPIWARISWIS
jgi:hypothetical protein